jgi:hypothetical protein
MVADIFANTEIISFITYYIFLLALAAGFILSAFTFWHGQRISRGETLVECLSHQDYELDSTLIDINKTSRVDNWKQFFGVHNFGEFLLRVLLPSIHKPKGNGVTTDYNDKNLVCYKTDPTRSKRLILYRSGSYPVDNYQSELLSRQKYSIMNTPSIYCQARISSVNWKNFV